MNILYSYKNSNFLSQIFSSSLINWLFQSNLKFGLIALSICTSPQLTNAQIVGSDCYAQGTSIEFGIAGLGGFEGADINLNPPPSGFHFRSNNPYFGFVSNPQLNAWATFDGDFFTPGAPENGWGIEIIDGAVDINASNNCMGEFGIPGAITGYTVDASCRVVTWEGDYINGSYNLHIKLDYVLLTNDLFYSTVVTIKNNGINIPEFYYYRNLDPDNNQSISGTYDTQNTIVSQPGTGCNKAHVKATSNFPSTQPLSYIGFAGIGNDFRVAHGGFANRDGSDIWNGAGFNSSTNSSTFGDEAIAIAYKIQNLAPTTIRKFRFVNILSDLSANNAINNLFSITWPGRESGSTSVCNPPIDTVTICNGNSIDISIDGSAMSDFNWSWSPATGLSSTTGTTVTATPTVNTLYTVIGTPINPCFDTVTLGINVNVFSGTVTANAGENITVCSGESRTIGTTATSGHTYNWLPTTGLSSSTVSNPTVTLTNPTGLPISTTYTVYANAGCINSDTVIVTVNPLISIEAGTIQTTCINSSITNITLATTGATGATFTGLPVGVSGSWATNVATISGTPSVAGTYNYTVSTIGGTGGCPPAETTGTISVTPIPAATINYGGSPYCNSLSTFQLVTLIGTGAYTGGVYSSTAGLSINPATGAITPSTSTPGTYTVTYTIAASVGCAAVTATTSVTITALPTASISYTGAPFCSTVVTAQAVTLTGAGAFTGGVYSSTAGLTINPATGAISPSTSITGTYTVTYTIAANAGCANVTTTTSVTITALPSASISYAATPFCSSVVTDQAVTLNGTGAFSGGIYSSTTGLAINFVSGNIVPATSLPGNYVVTYTIPASGGCASVLVSTNVTITPKPTAIIYYGGSPYCNSLSTFQLVTLTGTNAFSGGIYSSTTGLAINSVSGSIVPATSLPGNYVVTYTTPNSGGCPGIPVTTVVTIINTPTPIGSSIQEFCATDSPEILNLSPSTADIIWYDFTTGGNQLNSSVSLLDNTYYYAATNDVVTGCESPNRLEVLVKINDSNPPTGDLEQIFCVEDNPTLGNLIMNTSNTLVWYDSAVGNNIVVDNTPLSNGDSFFASNFDSTTNCYSTERTKVDITLLPCELEINNLLTLNGNNLNDFIFIKNIETFPKNEFQIFNRYGKLVWRGYNYNNLQNTFTGKANVQGVYNSNDYLPTATYFYVLTYFDMYRNENKEVKGFLQLNNNQ